MATTRPLHALFLIIGLSSNGCSHTTFLSARRQTSEGKRMNDRDLQVCGRVIDLHDIAVPKAVITSNDLAFGPTPMRTQADSSGNFCLPPPMLDFFEVEVAVTEGKLCSIRRVKPGQFAVLRLRPKVTRRLIVRSSKNGAPLGGAVISSDDMKFYQTNADGLAIVELPPQQNNVTVAAPGFVEIHRDLGPARANELQTIFLTEQQNLTVNVVDKNDTSVPQAQVSMVAQFFEGMNLFHVTADSNGRCTAPYGTPGMYQFFFSPPATKLSWEDILNTKSMEEDVLLGAGGNNNVTLKLDFATISDASPVKPVENSSEQLITKDVGPRAQNIFPRGRVQDETGLGVSGARIHSCVGEYQGFCGCQESFFESTTTADANGYFSFEEPISSSSYLCANWPDVFESNTFAEDIVGVPSAAISADAIELRLVKGGQITGQLAFTDGTSPAIHYIDMGFETRNHVSSTDGTFLLETFYPGQQTIRFYGPEFVEKEFVVNVPSQGTVDVGRINVDRGLLTHGHVISTSGEDVIDAQIIPYSLCMSQKSLTNNFNCFITVSDKSGRFTIEGLQAGHLLIRHPQFGVAETRISSGTQDIVLHPPSSICGEVGISPIDKSLRVVTLQDMHRGTQRKFWTRGKPYCFDNLSPGRYCLSGELRLPFRQKDDMPVEDSLQQTARGPVHCVDLQAGTFHLFNMAADNFLMAIPEDKKAE